MVAASIANGQGHSEVLNDSRRRVALILGGNYRALGVVRSLGRQGIPVWVVNQDGHVLAGLSRYAERTLPWPDGDDALKIGYLEELAARHSTDQFLLIPTDDECTTLISQNHDLLAGKFVLTTPPWISLQWAVNKKQMYQLGDRLGIDQPRTLFPRSLEMLASFDLRFPVILKPATREVLNPLTKDKAWQVEDRPRLLTRFIEACKHLPPESIMVQELIPGGAEAQYSYAALCLDGKPLASLVAIRARQFPMDFGRFSTFVETVEETAVATNATKLLEAIRFTGLVEVEFKRDRRDGSYKLLDINPRIWGWHSLCASAGVDFSHLLWKLKWKQSLPEVRAHSGARWVRFAPDFVVAIGEMVKGRLALSDYLRGLRPPVETAIFAFDDPLPALCEFPALFGLLCRRALNRLKSRNKSLATAPTPGSVAAGRNSAILAAHHSE
jgi:predicted ATP-grasp superfamily ATP-dependent carboligase